MFSLSSADLILESINESLALCMGLVVYIFVVVPIGNKIRGHAIGPSRNYRNQFATFPFTRVGIDCLEKKTHQLLSCYLKHIKSGRPSHPYQ